MLGSSPFSSFAYSMLSPNGLTSSSMVAKMRKLSARPTTLQMEMPMRSDRRYLSSRWRSPCETRSYILALQSSMREQAGLNSCSNGLQLSVLFRRSRHHATRSGWRRQKTSQRTSSLIFQASALIPLSKCIALSKAGSAISQAMSMNGCSSNLFGICNLTRFTMC